jgi:hypothetical protein
MAALGFLAPDGIWSEARAVKRQSVTRQMKLNINFSFAASQMHQTEIGAITQDSKTRKLSTLSW